MAILKCVDGQVLQAKKNQYILQAGDTTDSMGLVLQGSVLIVQEDLWGNRHIIAKIGQGNFFGETYAVTQGAVLKVSVVVQEDAEILLLNTSRVLSTCPNACTHHSKLVRNLVTVLAGKLLVMNEKITHISKRSTKEKLLSYLSSEAVKQKSLSFEIPFNRQQLADYLCVERAAMSVELSRMQKQGIFTTQRNHFQLNPEYQDME